MKTGKRRKLDDFTATMLAEKYNGRTDMKNKDVSLYRYLHRRGLMNDVFPIDTKPHGYWTYERCKEIADKCDSRMDFIKTNRSAYDKSLMQGWLDKFF